MLAFFNFDLEINRCTSGVLHNLYFLIKVLDKSQSTRQQSGNVPLLLALP